jgi:hypothetical protein
VSPEQLLELREERERVAAKQKHEMAANREWVTRSIQSEASPQIDNGEAWNNWFDSRFAERMAPLLEAVAEHLAAELDKDREKSRDELAQEVSRLWCIVSELQATIRAFNRLEAAKAGSPTQERGDTLQ